MTHGPNDMNQNFGTWLQRLGWGFLAATAIFAVATPQAVGGSAPRAVAASDSLPSALTVADATAAGRLIGPEDLARSLADPTAQRPALLQVGFKVLFRSGHIVGSRYIGPASKPEGLAALKKALQTIPRQGPVVLYCGCCPWTDCPNVRPAYRLARKMGFKNLRILYIAKNLQHDWIDKGLPISQDDQ